jgi:hypothetical protein
MLTIRFAFRVIAMAEGGVAASSSEVNSEGALCAVYLWPYSPRDFAF